MIFHPVDSTSGTTYHDEILLPNLSNKHPTVHYFITAYDLHHAYARNESMPSDTITIKVFSPSMAASSRLHSDENAALRSHKVSLIKRGRKIILTGKGKVEIYDPSGRLIGRFTVDGWKELNLKAGIYMFRIDGKIRKEVVR